MSLADCIFLEGNVSSYMNSFIVESWPSESACVRLGVCGCVSMQSVDVRLCKPFVKFAAEKQEAGWKSLLPSYCSIVAFPDKQGIYHYNCLMGSDVFINGYHSLCSFWCFEY